MKRPSISVIIPCYNAEKYVVETLESLENQVYKPYEVICVNDGSCDNTKSVIESYANTSMLNLILVDQKNSGVSVARNTGIERANGDVLLFLDSDDMYASDFLLDVAEGIAKGYDTIFCYFTHNKNELSHLTNFTQKKNWSKQDLMTEFMYFKDRCHTSAFAYKRELIDKRNILFTAGAKYGEDWEFTTRYLDLCDKGLCIGKYSLFYRQSDTSAMHKITYSHVDSIAAAERAEQYLLNYNSECYKLFYEYMRHRATFSVIHLFSKYSQKEMFKRFCKEYQVRNSMFMLAKNRYVPIKVKVASALFIASKWAFYIFAKLR